MTAFYKLALPGVSFTIIITVIREGSIVVEHDIVIPSNFSDVQNDVHKYNSELQNVLFNSTDLCTLNNTDTDAFCFYVTDFIIATSDLTAITTPSGENITSVTCADGECRNVSTSPPTITRAPTAMTTANAENTTEVNEGTASEGYVYTTTTSPPETTRTTSAGTSPPTEGTTSFYCILGSCIPVTTSPSTTTASNPDVTPPPVYPTTPVICLGENCTTISNSTSTTTAPTSAVTPPPVNSTTPVSCPGGDCTTISTSTSTTTTATTSEKPSTTPSPCAGGGDPKDCTTAKSILMAQVRITVNENFSEELLDKNSQKYKDFENNFLMEIKKLYEKVAEVTDVKIQSMRTAKSP
ncbi:integumentary mucin A.1-like [Hyperolius riggenbachi]|uniref:integumentary mucin A.1-like n=1 Tax=Hyperolius riggenbachi TaxID=752182 RepID=UPI0035A292F7